MADVVVVGGGVGGLAAALRLGVAGHRVVVLERNATVGGKLAGRAVDGFTFDTGPSLLALPQVFDDLLGVAGTSLADEVDLVRLQHTCRYRWPDGSVLDTSDRVETTAAAVEHLSPGQGVAFTRFLDRGRRVWDVAERSFLSGPLEGALPLIRRMRSPFDVAAIDPVRTLHGRARRTFDDPRLVQWADRYATYSGSSPYRAPATLACIAWAEQAFGSWYVRGGLAVLADALARVAQRCGVELRTHAEVAALEVSGGEVDGGAVRGVRLLGGERLAADVVVSGVDATHLYRDLVPDAAALLPGRRAAAVRRARRAPRSSSAFALLLGLDGTTPDLAHHNVSFAADYAAEFGDIFDRRCAPADPTVYVCCSSVTDPSQAPASSENWFVLVNVPAGWVGDPDRYRDHLLSVLARRGWDVTERVRVAEMITPTDIEQRDRSPGGAIYGTSSNGRRAAFLRPRNRGSVPGLYLVGGSTHPGGGLPLVATSGAIVAAMVAGDGWRAS